MTTPYTNAGEVRIPGGVAKPNSAHGAPFGRRVISSEDHNKSSEPVDVAGGQVKLTFLSHSNRPYA
jgi:hypothetical protein